jgi:hypothetical protein
MAPGDYENVGPYVVEMLVRRLLTGLWLEGFGVLRFGLRWRTPCLFMSGAPTVFFTEPGMHPWRIASDTRPVCHLSVLAYAPS